MPWASADRRGAPRERTACAGLRRECASASSAFRGSPCGVQFAFFSTLFSFVQLSLMFVNTYAVYSTRSSFNPPIPAPSCLPPSAKGQSKGACDNLSLSPLSCLSRLFLWSGASGRARGAGTCAVWGCEHISYYYTRSHTRYHDTRGTYTPQADLGRTGVERSKANGPRQSNAKAGAACRHGSIHAPVTPP